MALRYVGGTFTADGLSNSVPINNNALIMIGPTGGGVTFDAGEVLLEVQGADQQWYASGVVVAEPDVRRVTLDFPMPIRLRMEGSTAPDLDYVIQSDRPE